MKNERHCEFMTVVSTGEKPDAEIHICAFKEKGGALVRGRQNGDTHTLIQMICSLIEDMGNTLRKKDSILAAAAFANIVGLTLHESVGGDGMKLAGKMLDGGVPVKVSGEEAIEKLTELLEALKGVVEEGDDD